MYLDELEELARRDIKILFEKEKEYGDSWKKRGGVGAFMMMARKWDRLEKQCENHPADPRTDVYGSPYDIFAHMELDIDGKGVCDDIGDLRRYLMLIEAEMIARGKAQAQGQGNPANVPSGDQVGTPEPRFTT